MYLKNYYHIIYSLMALLVVSLPLCGKSKRRRALQEKNKVMLAMNQPDTLAQTFGKEQALLPDEEDTTTQTVEEAEVVNPELDALETEVTETADGSPRAATETPNHSAPHVATMANLPESVIIEETPLHMDDATIELYFENADLLNFIKQIEDLFDISFIMDDALEPLPQNTKTLKGNKITYRTEKPITRARAWSVFNTFLNIAGFAIIPHTNPRTYRIVPIAQAQRGPVPTYIGVPFTTLPETDELIRYVYFLENNTVEGIRSVVEQFRSTASTAVYLNEHRGFILTDIAYNIKKLMEIIHELDKVTMPESLSILKLRQADAKQIKELYESLTGGDKQQAGPRPPNLPQKKPAGLALPENVTIIAEPRNNTLILLGPKAAREQIEEFVKTIDVSIDQAYAPVHTYQLKYANAETIADIMNNVTKFGSDTEAGRAGGVRGGDKYMRPMSFIPEPATNTLVVKAHYEDFLKAEKIIQQLDEDQPQVAIEVLILGVTTSKDKELGAQLRSKVDGPGLGGGISGLVGNNIKFQTSGMFLGNNVPTGIVQNTSANNFGVKRLLGNLLDLLTGAGVANTIITMGEDIYGVWGILQLLETISNVQVVSNPFLIATNKTPALVEVGQTRRVPTATVAAATQTGQLTALGNESANLQVQITPQINSDGMIILDLEINYDNFLDSANLTSATKETRKIKTSAILADKQVLAIGGLLQETINENQNKVPGLGDIPVFGWLFKNKQKDRTETNLLILLSSRIIEATNERDLAKYNKKHFDQYKGTLTDMQAAVSRRDPIHKIYFGSTGVETFGDDFIFKHSEKRKKSGRGKMKEKMIQVQRNIEQKAAKQMAQAQARPLQQFADGRIEMFNTSPQPQPQKVAYTPPPTPIPASAKASSFVKTSSFAEASSFAKASADRSTGMPVIAASKQAMAAPQSVNSLPKLETVAHADTKSAPSNLQSLRSKKRSDLSLSNILPTAAEQAAKGVA